MASTDHLEVLKQGLGAWSAFRESAPSVRPDLSEADLIGANLFGADLRGANLFRANLRGANLNGEANLRNADLREAILQSAQLDSAFLCGADLRKADLREANLFGAHLQGADLRQANLRFANLLDADLRNADLTGALVFGASAWKLKLEGATQQDLVITEFDQPSVTVDNIEVAQFVFLLLNNEKIRDVINTMGKKAVLILGRFTPARKPALDAVREKLRGCDYLPIMFDFDKPIGRDTSETISLLAHMARFIIADLTDPSSIPKELEAIVPGLAVPVQPLLEGSTKPYAMFKDYWKYDWVLPLYRYEGLQALLASLAEKVIAPAEAKVKALEEKRRAIEVELTAPRTSA